MKVPLVGEYDVLGHRIGLEARPEEVLPGEVEHHVVLHDVDENAAILPEKGYRSRGALAVVDHGELRGQLGAGRPFRGPPEALEQARGEYGGRVAPAVPASGVEDETPERGLEPTLAAHAQRWGGAARHGGRSRRGRLVGTFVSENARDERRLLPATVVESERRARRLEFVAPENVKEAAEVERALPNDGVDVCVDRAPIGDVELEAGRELAEAVARELLEQDTAVAWRETGFGHDESPIVAGPSAGRVRKAAALVSLTSMSAGAGVGRRSRVHGVGAGSHALTMAIGLSTSSRAPRSA